MVEQLLTVTRSQRWPAPLIYLGVQGSGGGGGGVAYSLLLFLKHANVTYSRRQSVWKSVNREFSVFHPGIIV